MELSVGLANQVALIAAAFFTSSLAGIVAVGGGILQLAVMAAFLPPASIVPLHGVVQLVSASTRALFGFRHIEWGILVQFVCGGLIGAYVGSQFVTQMPPEIIPILLGIIIIIVTWMPGIKIETRVHAKFLWLGGIQTFLSLFVGATGPLSSSVLLREGLQRDRFVVTHAVLQTTVHLIKVITFGLIGFLFAPYLPLLAGMVVSVALGSYFGTHLRGKVPERLFRRVITLLLTILAIRMFLRLCCRFSSRAHNRAVFFGGSHEHSQKAVRMNIKGLDDGAREACFWLSSVTAGTRKSD